MLYQINLVEDARRLERVTPPRARRQPDVEDVDEFSDEPTAQLEPPKPFAPAILAIDIGGTKFAAGLVSTKGELLDRASVRGRARRRP